MLKTQSLDSVLIDSNREKSSGNSGEELKGIARPAAIGGDPICRASKKIPAQLVISQQDWLSAYRDRASGNRTRAPCHIDIRGESLWRRNIRGAAHAAATGL